MLRVKRFDKSLNDKYVVMVVVLVHCTPFEILNSIISFDPANMIDVWLAVRVWDKCLSY